VIVFGVDPGSQRTGYGAIESDGRTHRLIEMGVLAPSPRLALPEKLAMLYGELGTRLDRLRPALLAVEDVFHSMNARSALILGHVRGVALLAGAERGIPVTAFAPATVKAQISGYGRAEKVQVALMVSRLLSLAQDAPPGDATDALAVALCGALQSAGPAATLAEKGLRAPRGRTRGAAAAWAALALARGR
jgi:crossover junction endodeoxyribonuclease RuvC